MTSFFFDIVTDTDTDTEFESQMDVDFNTAPEIQSEFKRHSETICCEIEISSEEIIHDFDFDFTVD